jgi:MoxR-like ATPase
VDVVAVFDYWLTQGGHGEPVVPEDYILTPTIETQVRDVARVIASGLFPVLLQGPTSSGKTSMVAYLAARTGHKLVRINNHEHTDIQEYLGSYVVGDDGRLRFQHGVLVEAVKRGHWIVLDELNLAPTDVLEALNRLLDDNRELYIPETQETIRAHPNFMLFATQNPPGAYGGRKALSRAFRNRFVELHFGDIPTNELETILCRRCRIPASLAAKLVRIMKGLQKARQGSKLFAGKEGFITLRDLFRWAERYKQRQTADGQGADPAGSDGEEQQEAPPAKRVRAQLLEMPAFFDHAQAIAMDGYMLLAERVRRPEERSVVQSVLEAELGTTLDPETLYSGESSRLYRRVQAEMPLATADTTHPLHPFRHVVWTKAMRRLFVLVERCLEVKEPVLLVGETGCGKTTVCQILSILLQRELRIVNCHLNTETADFLGSLRPVRHDGEQEAREVDDIADAGAEQKEDVQTGTEAETEAEAEADGRSPSASGQLDTGRLFEWVDGPLVQSMREGDVFLVDEISLAEDSVLERLNSVLEPSRTLLLAERAGHGESIVAHENFAVLGTMNPGGDFGKKELSPALRNRFTEIWVPAVTDEVDLTAILVNALDGALAKDAAALINTMLEFPAWLRQNHGFGLAVSLRDYLTWAHFVRATADTLGPAVAFVHGACLTFVDGLGAASSAGVADARSRRRSCIVHLLDAMQPAARQRVEAAGVDDGTYVPLPSTDTARFGMAPFYIALGDSLAPTSFTLDAPTTAQNMFRVLRALQVSKPILLEGSPGVGKTSLVVALGKMTGHHVERINLSEQTDVMDLFGSDLPVEGRIGEFAWRDGQLLKALRQGHWVVLDELNLASQAVLEGLNACLDHRGEVFVPELNRTFHCPPGRFRLFACQNPQHQGGGRKGLPKSFLNRFTQVYVDALAPEDMKVIATRQFPALPEKMVAQMVEFNLAVHKTSLKYSGRLGSGEDVNLRDVFRWCELVEASQQPGGYDPRVFAPTIYAGRLAALTLTTQHRQEILAGLMAQFLAPDAAGVGLQAVPHGRPGGSGSDAVGAGLQELPFHTPWSTDAVSLHVGPKLCIAASVVLAGAAALPRREHAPLHHAAALRLDAQLSTLHTMPQLLCYVESAAHALQRGWTLNITGPAGAGKTALARLLAAVTGNTLCEFAMNSAVDTMELLGGFEQVDLAQEHVTTLNMAKDALSRVFDALVANVDSAAEGVSAVISGAPTTPWLREAMVDVARAWQRLASRNGFLQQHATTSPMAAGDIPRGVLAAGADGGGPSAEAGDEDVPLDLDRLDALVTALKRALEGVGSTPLEVEARQATAALEQRRHRLGRLRQSHRAGAFQWCDGILVQALRSGCWLLIDNVNFCSPAVLDRLNGLLEPGGTLLLSERGVVDGEVEEIRPHPNFRLLFAMDPRHGNISPAMRNRSLEVPLEAGLLGADQSGEPSLRTPAAAVGLLMSAGVYNRPTIDALALFEAGLKERAPGSLRQGRERALVHAGQITQALLQRGSSRSVALRLALHDTYLRACRSTDHAALDMLVESAVAQLQAGQPPSGRPGSLSSLRLAVEHASLASARGAAKQLEQHLRTASNFSQVSWYEAEQQRACLVAALEASLFKSTPVAGWPVVQKLLALTSPGEAAGDGASCSLSLVVEDVLKAVWLSSWANGLGCLQRGSPESPPGRGVMEQLLSQQLLSSVGPDLLCYSPSLLLRLAGHADAHGVTFAQASLQAKLLFHLVLQQAEARAVAVAVQANAAHHRGWATQATFLRQKRIHAGRISHPCVRHLWSALAALDAWVCALLQPVADKPQPTLRILPEAGLAEIARLVAFRRNFWLAAERGSLHAEDADLAHDGRDRLDAVRTHWNILVSAAELVEKSLLDRSDPVVDAAGELHTTWVEARQRLSHALAVVPPTLVHVVGQGIAQSEPFHSEAAYTLAAQLRRWSRRLDVTAETEADLLSASRGLMAFEDKDADEAAVAQGGGSIYGRFCVARLCAGHDWFAVTMEQEEWLIEALATVPLADAASLRSCADVPAPFKAVLECAEAIHTAHGGEADTNSSRAKLNADVVGGRRNKITSPSGGGSVKQQQALLVALQQVPPKLAESLHTAPKKADDRFRPALAAQLWTIIDPVLLRAERTLLARAAGLALACLQAEGHAGATGGWQGACAALSGECGRLLREAQGGHASEPNSLRPQRGSFSYLHLSTLKVLAWSLDQLSRCITAPEAVGGAKHILAHVLPQALSAASKAAWLNTFETPSLDARPLWQLVSPSHLETLTEAEHESGLEGSPVYEAAKAVAVESDTAAQVNADGYSGKQGVGCLRRASLSQAFIRLTQVEGAPMDAWGAKLEQMQSARTFLFAKLADVRPPESWTEALTAVASLAMTVRVVTQLKAATAAMQSAGLEIVANLARLSDAILSETLLVDDLQGLGQELGRCARVVEGMVLAEEGPTQPHDAALAQLLTQFAIPALHYLAAACEAQSHVLLSNAGAAGRPHAAAEVALLLSLAAVATHALSLRTAAPAANVDDVTANAVKLQATARMYAEATALEAALHADDGSPAVLALGRRREALALVGQSLAQTTVFRPPADQRMRGTYASLFDLVCGFLGSTGDPSAIFHLALQFSVHVAEGRPGLEACLSAPGRRERWADICSQESLVQEALDSFLKRLEAEYLGLPDVVHPIETSVARLRDAVRQVRDAAERMRSAQPPLDNEPLALDCSGEFLSPGARALAFYVDSCVALPRGANPRHLPATNAGWEGRFSLSTQILVRQLAGAATKAGAVEIASARAMLLLLRNTIGWVTRALTPAAHRAAPAVCAASLLCNTEEVTTLAVAHDVFELIAGLHEAAEAQEAERIAAETALYKYKLRHFEALTDDEAAERSLRRMFPSYFEAFSEFDDDDLGAQPPSTTAEEAAPEAADEAALPTPMIRDLVQCHTLLFAPGPLYELRLDMDLSVLKSQRRKHAKGGKPHVESASGPAGDGRTRHLPASAFVPSAGDTREALGAAYEAALVHLRRSKFGAGQLDDVMLLTHLVMGKVTEERFGGGADPGMQPLDAANGAVGQTSADGVVLSDEEAALPPHPDRGALSTPLYYDFYHDEHPVEAQRARQPLQALTARVAALLVEWPEHPSLQIVQTITARLLSMPVASPLPKFLTGMELLLRKAQDWQQVAAKHVSLAAELVGISDLIIRWRKLELHQWPRLLPVVWDECHNAAAQTWFSLYRLLCRLPEALGTEAQAGEENAQANTRADVDAHLLVVHSRLRAFLEQSTLGEFLPRLDILWAFAGHLDAVTATYDRFERRDAPGSPNTDGDAVMNGEVDLNTAGTTSRQHREYFSRLASLVRSVCQLHAHCVPAVEDAVREARLPLEKDLKGFVKLARWKDSNFAALKEAAEKTHRALHKFVVRYRAALAEPVAPVLGAVKVGLEFLESAYAMTVLRESASTDAVNVRVEAAAQLLATSGGGRSARSVPETLRAAGLDPARGGPVGAFVETLDLTLTDTPRLIRRASRLLSSRDAQQAVADDARRSDAVGQLAVGIVERIESLQAWDRESVKQQLAEKAEHEATVEARKEAFRNGQINSADEALDDEKLKKKKGNMRKHGKLMKHAALADLIKVLKKIGLSARSKAARQPDVLAPFTARKLLPDTGLHPGMLEQAGLGAALKRCDEYYYRVAARLMACRRHVQAPHKDVSQRLIEQCYGVVEHLGDAVVQQRNVAGLMLPEVSALLSLSFDASGLTAAELGAVATADGATGGLPIASLDRLASAAGECRLLFLRAGTVAQDAGLVADAAPEAQRKQLRPLLDAVNAALNALESGLAATVKVCDQSLFSSKKLLEASRLLEAGLDRVRTAAAALRQGWPAPVPARFASAIVKLERGCEKCTAELAVLCRAHEGESMSTGRIGENGESDESGDNEVAVVFSGYEALIHALLLGLQRFKATTFAASGIQPAEEEATEEAEAVDAAEAANENHVDNLMFNHLPEQHRHLLSRYRALNVSSVLAAYTKLADKLQSLTDAVLASRGTSRAAATEQPGVVTALTVGAKLLHEAAPLLQLHAEATQGAAQAFIGLHGSTCKLTYVVLGLCNDLARRGFCVPPELDDGGEGEGGTLEGVDGTGIGAGEGAKDVSKEIEDEEQVLGNKNDPAPDEPPPEDMPEEDDGLEMANDFDGELYDREPNPEGEDDNSEDDDDREDMEEEMGDASGEGAETLDRDMWAGDSDEEEDQPQDGQETGGQQTGETELGARQDDAPPEPKGKDDPGEKGKTKEPQGEEGGSGDEGASEPEINDDYDEDGDAQMPDVDRRQEEEEGAGGEDKPQEEDDPSAHELPDDLNLDGGVDGNDENDNDTENEEEDAPPTEERTAEEEEAAKNRDDGEREAQEQADALPTDDGAPEGEPQPEGDEEEAAPLPEAEEDEDAMGEDGGDDGQGAEDSEDAADPEPHGDDGDMQDPDELGLEPGQDEEPAPPQENEEAKEDQGGEEEQAAQLQTPNEDVNAREAAETSQQLEEAMTGVQVGCLKRG